MPRAPGLGVATAFGLLGLALLAGFTAHHSATKATVLDSVEAAAQHAAGGKTNLSACSLNDLRD